MRSVSRASSCVKRRLPRRRSAARSSRGRRGRGGIDGRHRHQQRRAVADDTRERREAVQLQHLERLEQVAQQRSAARRGAPAAPRPRAHAVQALEHARSAPAHAATTFVEDPLPRAGVDAERDEHRQRQRGEGAEEKTATKSRSSEAATVLVPANMASSRINGWTRENMGSSRISELRNKYQMTELSEASLWRGFRASWPRRPRR